MLIPLNPRTRQYFDDSLKLACSIVVKSDIAIDAINNTVLEDLASTNYTIDEIDPSTWKFYMNIKGLYHITDKKMKVKSLDSLEEIEFTLDNLKIHKATKIAYVYGSDYYNELVEKYPEQEILIRGIVNPSTVSEPWKLPDGSILNYQSDLVESNEYGLIDTVQTWLISYMSRWVIPDFARNNDLYAALVLANPFSKIVCVILNHRFQNCFTNQAHTFHVTEFLRSNLYLDEFIDQLTNEQRMFLYRNIPYLIQSVGKESVFQTLLQKILRDRGIPLYAYNFRMNYNDMTYGKSTEPTYEFIQKELGVTGITNITQTYTADAMLERIGKVLPGNSKLVEADKEKLIVGLEKSRFSEVPTKIVESIVTDTSNYTNYSVEDFALNEWIYLAGEGRYTASYTGNNPITGEGIELGAKDAFVMYYYLTNYYYWGDNPTFLNFRFSDFYCHSVRTDTLPTKEELLQNISPKYRNMADGYIDYILNNHEVNGSYQNVYDFNAYCTKVFNRNTENKTVLGNVEHMQLRGQLEATMTLLYESKRYSFGEGNLNDWAVANGVDVTTMAKSDILTIMDAIAAQCVGITSNTSSSLHDLHKSMINIMRKLTSYNLLYLQTINSDGLMLSDWPSVRIGDILTHVLYTPKEKMAVLTSLKTSSKSILKIDYQVPTLLTKLKTTTNIIRARIDVNIKSNSGVKHITTVKGSYKDNGLSATTTYE